MPQCAEDTLPSSSSRVAPKWLPQESKGSDSFLPSAPPPDDEEGFAVPVAGVNQQQPPSYNTDDNEGTRKFYNIIHTFTLKQFSSLQQLHLLHMILFMEL